LKPTVQSPVQISMLAEGVSSGSLPGQHDTYKVDLTNNTNCNKFQLKLN